MYCKQKVCYLSFGFVVLILATIILVTVILASSSSTVR